MREVRVFELCDYCRDDEGHEDTEATGSITFAVGGTVYRYDHCEAHANPEWLTLRRLSTRDAEANGKASAARATRPPAEMIRCPYCGGQYRAVQGITTHIARMHPDHFERWRGRRLAPVPAPESAPLSCPECGRDDFANRTALGIHRKRAHGVRGTAHRPRGE